MRILVVFRAVTRNWLRSRSGLFFSFLFPVILLFVFGSIYGGPDAGQIFGQNATGYYLPSLTAAFIMTNGVIGLTSVGSELRRTGVVKRLSVTPLSKLQWLLGNILSQAVLALVLATVMLILGITVYHAAVSINVYSVAMLVLGALLFSGVGMSLAGIVKDPEAASGLGNAIAFPMMLLSGTFWPVSVMPWYLQGASWLLPLTYFVDGLHSSMTSANPSAALTDLGVVAIFACVFIAFGALATRWKEE